MTAVLFVCTGNICRSPTAEAVMRALVVKQGLDHLFHIDSAGTHGYHVGDGPDRRSVAAAASRGISMKGLVARPVEISDFDQFDLILAMDNGHLRHLRKMQPPGSRAKVALFMDFDRDGRSGRDVPDPYYGAGRGFEDVFDMIEVACGGLLAHLHPEK
jgi:protein-tyrosine phosphatase